LLIHLKTVLVFIAVQFHDGRKLDKVHVPERDHLNTQQKRSSHIKLGEQPECAADVHRLCSKLGGSNNFAIIDCLQDDNLASIFWLLYCH